MKTESNEFYINARKLKKILLNKSGFSDWIKRNINKNRLIENKDYILKNEKIKLLENSKARKLEYFFTEEASQKIILSNIRCKTEKEKEEKLKNIIKWKENLDKEKEIKTIKFEDKEYPEQLRRIKNPPQQLYIKGNIQNLREYGIAVIGSRRCSNYGRSICKIFTNNLIGYNLNIISGLAIGIDTCAHKAAIVAKGKTLAVLPSGFNNIYPEENEELVNQILENGGTVLTEYAPEFEKTKESCRERNRIMSGLAIATLVVEAREKSGTSITVRYTNEQNKKAFCIPSSLLNDKGKGTNEMIKENRAQIVTEVEDIIKEFPELKLERKPNFNFLETKREIESRIKKSQKTKLRIKEENLDVYNFLTTKPQDIDEIAKALNKPIDEILYKLTLLELEGAIEELPGKKFKIK